MIENQTKIVLNWTRTDFVSLSKFKVLSCFQITWNILQIGFNFINWIMSFMKIDINWGLNPCLIHNRVYKFGALLAMCASAPKRSALWNVRFATKGNFSCHCDSRKSTSWPIFITTLFWLKTGCIGPKQRHLWEKCMANSSRIVIIVIMANWERSWDASKWIKMSRRLSIWHSLIHPSRKN